jgi:Ca2+-binding RTX toxin-like protein
MRVCQPVWARLGALQASLLAVAGLLVIAAFPANGLAATASVFVDDDGDRVVAFKAGVGEANHVETSITQDQTATIHDSGALILAGAGCFSVDASTVECPHISGATLRLGDLDDTFFLAMGFGEVHGDAGADTLLICPRCMAALIGDEGDDTLTGRGFLAGGNGHDVLAGSPWRDYLEGGPGNDTIMAGGGSDWITPSGGDDTIDAGAGDDDLLDYSGMRGPLAVNLRMGVATGAGRDMFTGVESAFGSDRGDLLIGDEKANHLRGGPGRDVIRGGAGADHLDGGFDFSSRPRAGSRDRLYGGPGADLLAGDLGNDILDGGRGRDRLLGGKGDDLLRARDDRRDIVNGQQGHDRARVDRGLDDVRGVESLI